MRQSELEQLVNDNCRDIMRFMACKCGLSAQSRVRRIADAIADIYPNSTTKQRINIAMRLVHQVTGITEIKARVNNAIRTYTV